MQSLEFEPPKPYRPASQAVHTKDVVAWASAPYLPAMQAVHTRDVGAAAVLLYHPATQLVHVEAPVANELY